VDAEILSTTSLKAASLNVLDTARVHGTHSLIRAVERIALNSSLHGDTSIENNVDHGRDGENICNRSKTVIFTQRMSSKGAVLLDEALRLHILEGSLFGDDELRGKQKTIGEAERIVLGPDIDVGKERERLNVPIAVHRVIHHVHVTLANGLTLYTTEVHSLLFRVILDYLDDGEAICHEQMGIGGFPDSSCSGR
jgi:hypothetical protein